MIRKSLLFLGATGFPALAAAGAVVGKGYVSYSITVVQLQDACQVAGGIAQRQQQPVNLENAHSNQVYLIDLDIGTPGQDAVVQLDTGSDELWVNPKCSSSNDPSFCQSLPQWSTTGSSSQSDSALGTGSITYGSGDVTFKYVEDFVTVGGMLPTAPALPFGEPAARLPSPISRLPLTFTLSRAGQEPDIRRRFQQPRFLHGHPRHRPHRIFVRETIRSLHQLPDQAGPYQQQCFQLGPSGYLRGGWYVKVA